MGYESKYLPCHFVPHYSHHNCYIHKYQTQLSDCFFVIHRSMLKVDIHTYIANQLWWKHAWQRTAWTWNLLKYADDKTQLIAGHSYLATEWKTCKKANRVISFNGVPVACWITWIQCVQLICGLCVDSALAARFQQIFTQLLHCKTIFLKTDSATIIMTSVSIMILIDLIDVKKYKISKSNTKTAIGTFVSFLNVPPNPNL